MDITTAEIRGKKSAIGAIDSMKTIIPWQIAAVTEIKPETPNVKMTTCPTKCANCRRQGELGSLLAFTRAPGVVLRCPACREVVLRIVETPILFTWKLGGARYLRLNRRARVR